jgi:hypothetical protein
MHIGDFNFPREDFKVYCHKHINQASIGAVVFELVNDPLKEFDPGWKCAIFGPEVGQTNDGDNHPNVAVNLKNGLFRKNLLPNKSMEPMR